MNNTADISLKGVMDLIKKSNFFLAPIYEAITNSLEAIVVKNYSNLNSPFINLNFHFSGLFDDYKNFEKVEIIDNGNGFNEESYNRFKTLLDKSKGFNNRGSGRIQYLHRFDNVHIKSSYLNEEILFTREFESNRDNLIFNPKEIPEILNIDTGTTMTLTGFKQDKLNKITFDEFSAMDIKREIKRKFLLKLYLDEKKKYNSPLITINFFKNEKLIESEQINPKEISTPENEDVFKVYYSKPSLYDTTINEIEWTNTENFELLNWAFFKLPPDELDFNGVFLCSKNVAIQEVPFFKIKKNDVYSGYRYLTVIYGDILDIESNLSDSVDKFLFPKIKSIEDEAFNNMFFDPNDQYLFIDNIENEVKKILPLIYTDVEALKSEQQEKVIFLAELHGISIDLIKSAGIEFSDNESKIVEKLYKRQAEDLARKNVKIHTLFDTLIDLNPTSEDYQQLLETKGKELLNLIPQQNKEELSRYVIRREMVTNILKLIVDNKLTFQKQITKKGERKDREGLIHDLIFKRKNITTNSLNDLWILNEEFVHFEGCSDIPINQIKDSAGNLLLRDSLVEDDLLNSLGINRKIRRPDIFLFLEEGKCVMIEFKHAGIDLSDHLNQLTKYSNLIANYSQKKIEQFYCYLIGENVNRLDIPGDFNKSIYGDFIKPNQPIRSVEINKEEEIIAYVYQEVLQLSSIHQRASVRNKSFADKLGIRLNEVPLK